MGLLQSTLSGLLIAIYAFYNRRNPYIWFILGFLYPIFSLVLLCILPILKKILRPTLVVTRGNKSYQRAPVRETEDSSVILESTPSFSLHVSPEDSAKLWYFLDSDRQTLGPMSFQAFYQKWKGGIITQDTLVWNDTFTDWKPFSTVFPSARP